MIGNDERLDAVDESFQSRKIARAKRCESFACRRIRRLVSDGERNAVESDGPVAADLFEDGKRASRRVHVVLRDRLEPLHGGSRRLEKMRIVLGPQAHTDRMFAGRGHDRLSLP
jgi:hypothetical protein